MGWSCTAAAGEVMDALNDYCLQTYGRHEWQYNGNTYFAGVGKEHEDGHISMQIWKHLPGGYAQRSGSIYIEPGGTIRRMPSYLKKEVLALLGQRQGQGKQKRSLEMLAIKKNLKEQTGTDDVTIMHCIVCGAEYSANAGDYWNHPDDYEFQCCGETMVLGAFKRVFVPKEE